MRRDFSLGNGFAFSVAQGALVVVFFEAIAEVGSVGEYGGACDTFEVPCCAG